MKNTFFSVIITFFLFLSGLNAQNFDKCGDAFVQQTIEDYTGSYEQTRIDFFEKISASGVASGTEATVYTIPVVVHIIYENNTDNISREQVLDAIRVLNRDYRRMNADTSNTRSIFKPVAADVEVEFVLAKLDPQGNCHEGITRTYSTLTVNAGNNVKTLVSWDNKSYMNVWVVRSINLQGSANVLGYAYKPFANQPPTLDGIVIRHDQMGTMGTAVAGGRTLVHEVGHYLGLDHPFLDGCFQGDNCADTPPVAAANFGCPVGVNSCSNDVPNLPDQVENYMDYADDFCTNMFTQNQKSLMRGSLANAQLRGYLVTSANYQLTGIVPGQALPCAPRPDFEGVRSQICIGETVQFVNKTYLGNALSYQWNFPGGTPASSSLENPSVTYSQAGNYEVELVASNSSGSNVLTRRGYVSVRSMSQTPYVNQFSDDFELYPIPNENWHVGMGNDTIQFRYYTKTAFAGSSCVTLQNFHAGKGEKDEIISHTISLFNSTSAILHFRMAFVERIQGNSDFLRIYVSDDCGVTWNGAEVFSGPQLRSTNVRHDTLWWPTSTNLWRAAQVNLSQYTMSPYPIMIKFEFTNGGGNNFYLDEVILASTIGVEQLFSDAHAVSVFPNPFHDVLVLKPSFDVTQIVLTDLSGRRVFFTSENIPEGMDYTLNLPYLLPGVYMMELRGVNQVVTEKIIKQ
jgi:PKD repeat protein